jgi:hypothetical protein
MIFDKITILVVFSLAMAIKLTSEGQARPTALWPKPGPRSAVWVDFRFVSVEIVNGELRWKVADEAAESVYYIELLVNDAWITEQVVPAKTELAGSYVLRLKQGGAGRYRVKFMAPDRKPQVSIEVELAADEVTYYPVTVADYLHFSHSVKYEVATSAGRLVLKGNGTSVDCRQLAPGLYYLSFNNRKETFLKK